MIDRDFAMKRMFFNLAKYGALDRVNYSTLVLNQDTVNRKKTTPAPPRSLLCQSCAAISDYGPELSKMAMTTIPAHLATYLMKEAIARENWTSVASMIANWPLEILRFRDVLSAEQSDIFTDEMGLDVVVFRGITSRTKKCNLKFLDLRGFALNWIFTKLIVQMWPLLSLKKSQRSVTRLTKLILKSAELEPDNRLATEIIPKLLKELLNNEMVKHPKFGINLPRCEKLTVLIDKLEFTTQNTFFMDYLITTCLRSITPIIIVATNIIVKSELNIGDEVLDSLAPFIIFRGQNPETLEGVCLENLEDNVFFITSESLQHFSQVRSLMLLNCNICLQEGRTRRRTSARTQLTKLLSSFHNLHRLDLSQNSFAGCLPEILDALHHPLEFLSLRECDMLDRDMIWLAESRHATSLQELNLSKVCGLFPDDRFAVSTGVLMRYICKFTNLTILTIAQNQITDNKVDDLCRAVTHWNQLKALNIAGNILSEQPALEVIRACTQVRTMQHIYLTYSHNLLQALNIMEHGRQDFTQKILNILRSCNRMDIQVDIAGLAYAVFA